MTVFVPESIKVLGSDAGGASVVLCDMFVDDLGDLPAPDAYNGYKLSMGCTATVINDNSRHRINSAGQWVQISAGTSTYTKTEIDSMIARIDATEAEDRAALAQQVDNSSKNLLKIIATPQSKNGITFSVSSDGSVSLNGTATSSTVFPLNDQIGLQHGQYILCGIVPRNVYLTGRSTLGTNYIVTHNNSDIRIDDDIYYTYINVSSGVTLDNVIIKPMLCTASDYAISPAFVPYAPNNRQLYELIKQYHP